MVFLINLEHGHSDSVINKIKIIKKKFDIELMVGNIFTPSGTKDLINAGADSIKVGINKNSNNKLNKISGIGMPSLTAITNCYSITKKENIPLIVDGELDNSGSILKALASGASCVSINNEKINKLILNLKTGLKNNGANNLKELYNNSRFIKIKTP